jgi:hypothetical protein
VKRTLVRAASALLLALSILPAMPAAASSEAPVLAKYYAWFDENTWGSGKLTDQPAQGYRSADRGTIERQVAQAQSAGIDGFQLNWWGPGNPTDDNLRTLLAVARGKGFKVSVDFDLNSPFLNGPGDTVAALNHLNQYLGDPAWFRYNGRPVVSFYGIRKYDVGTWGSIRGQVGGDALWIGEGDQFGYLQVFDGMHPYSVAWSGNPSAQLASYASRTRAYPGKLWVATVMPGYNDTLLGRGAAGFAVDRAGGDYYRRLWQGAIATQPAFVTITSWNEWLEGSQIEPSKTYGDSYLQITREMADQFGGSLASKAVAPSAAAPAPGNANGCAFKMGFAALRGMIPSVVGGCIENEHHNPENGDALQRTSGGLLVWRKADNFTAFTDGSRTWVNGPYGLQSRSNSERFAWEK